MTAGQSGWSAPPEEIGPAPGVEFGGYGSRLIAYIVDGIIVAIVTTVIILVGVLILTATSDFTLDQTGTVQSGTVSAGGVTALFTAFLLALIFSVLYFPWFWARGGQTPGMRMTNIRVVSRPGRYPDQLGTGDPAPHRLVDLGRGLLHRVHLDLHRRAASELGRPHRRDARHQVLNRGVGAPPH